MISRICYRVFGTTYGLKPYPFYLGVAFALLDLLISFFVVKDTRKFTLLEIEEGQEEEKESEKRINQDKTTEATITEKTVKSNFSSSHTYDDNTTSPSFMQVFSITSWKTFQCYL